MEDLAASADLVETISKAIFGALITENGVQALTLPCFIELWSARAAMCVAKQPTETAVIYTDSFRHSMRCQFWNLYLITSKEGMMEVAEAVIG